MKYEAIRKQRKLKKNEEKKELNKFIEIIVDNEKFQLTQAEEVFPTKRLPLLSIITLSLPPVLKSI